MADGDDGKAEIFRAFFVVKMLAVTIVLACVAAASAQLPASFQVCQLCPRKPKFIPRSAPQSRCSSCDLTCTAFPTPPPCLQGQWVGTYATAYGIREPENENTTDVCLPLVISVPHSFLIQGSSVVFGPVANSTGMAGGVTYASDGEDGTTYTVAGWNASNVLVLSDGAGYSECQLLSLRGNTLTIVYLVSSDADPCDPNSYTDTSGGAASCSTLADGTPLAQDIGTYMLGAPSASPSASASVTASPSFGAPPTPSPYPSPSASASVSASASATHKAKNEKSSKAGAGGAGAGVGAAASGAVMSATVTTVALAVLLGAVAVFAGVA